MKSILIIGGGVSGLTAGIYARKAGFAVDVYEKNGIVGGECTGWDRNGYHIDNCIHWLMGTTPGSALHRIWLETGALGDDVEVIRQDRMYTSELGGESVTLWQDIDRTQAELLRLSPADEAEIKKLMDACRLGTRAQIPAEKPPELMGPLDAVKLTTTMKSTLKLFKEYHGMDTADLMARFSHPLIRCMIADFCTRESLGHSFPITYGNFVSGDGGIPRGGSRAMAERMRARLEQLGGNVHAAAPVARVLPENRRATRVQLADGQMRDADYIVCACDPDFTFGHLLPESYTDPMLREVYDHPTAYPVYGMFQAAYAVDAAMDAVQGERMLPCEDLRVADWMGERMTVKCYAYEPSFAPEGKQIVQVLIGLSAAGYDYWMRLYQEDKRNYVEAKTALARAALQKLEQRFPAYRGKLWLLDAWTPVTYRRYCNAYKGYNQAYTITKHSRKNPYPAAWVQELDNVLLAGQWLSPPGGLPGAAIQGKYAVQRILKKEKMDYKL